MTKTDRAHITSERCLSECIDFLVDLRELTKDINKLLDTYYLPEAVVPNLISTARLLGRATDALEVATSAAKLAASKDEQNAA